jgi:hypothetical protein
MKCVRIFGEDVDVLFIFIDLFDPAVRSIMSLSNHVKGPPALSVVILNLQGSKRGRRQARRTTRRARSNRMFWIGGEEPQRVLGARKVSGPVCDLVKVRPVFLSRESVPIRPPGHRTRNRPHRLRLTDLAKRERGSGGVFDMIIE